ncbi:uncharacterized protein LOC129584278 [Paramacrobiotus metropolitanus]|uniref:uncharacterized protein LOC129584278 n=1 Tax=Paramacrobiotus metropolitanus TaxID=2943436 RepID=UPI00244659DA|nr:uncharacterized protein LOC129584278 [Paramacrobiotus metropolitanus]
MGPWGSKPAGPDLEALRRQREAEYNAREQRYREERKHETESMMRQMLEVQQRADAERQRLEAENRAEQQRNLEARMAEMQRRDKDHEEQRARERALFEQRLQEMTNASTAERRQMQEEFKREQQRLEEERRAAMDRRDAEHRAQQEREKIIFQKQLDDLKGATEAERMKLQEDFRRQQENMEARWAGERQHYEEKLSDMAESMQEAEEKVREMAEQLEKPIKDRENKVAFVNGLNLKIRQNNSLLLVGPKGMGKSTFLWLLNIGKIPKRTIRDGTVDIIQLPGFVDSIGLRGWTPEELLKLVVLMIYEGIPKDLIMFSNDRIDLPINSLGLLGINNPLIVVMSSDFWKLYQSTPGGKQKIHLRENAQGVRMVEPAEDLEYVYNMPVYEDIRAFHLGMPVTHHDDIEAIVRGRQEVGIQPFQFLMDKLGDIFTVGMDNDSNKEALFRFIYIYEKKYARDQLKFMNSATLQDFNYVN